MEYKFKCVKCHTVELREIPMSCYDEQKDKQICKCSSKMKRVIEFGGTIELCKGMYGTDNVGGWNY